MTNQAGIGDEVAALRAELAAQGNNHSEPLEERLHRLETAIAAIQDTRLMEERVLARLSTRLSPDAPPAPPHDAPTAPDAPPADHPPRGLLKLPPAAALLGSNLPPASSWSIVELVRELRLMIGMFFDYRFSVSLTARLVPMFALAGMVLSYIFLGSSSIFLLSWFFVILDKLVDLVLVLITYKVLSREVARYRKEVSYLPPYRR
jgi:hypothetical protein